MAIPFNILDVLIFLYIKVGISIHDYLACFFTEETKYFFLIFTFFWDKFHISKLYSNL